MLLEMRKRLEGQNEMNFPHSPIPSHCNESAYGKTIVENIYDETLKERVYDESIRSSSRQTEFHASGRDTDAISDGHSKWARRPGEVAACGR